MIGLKRGLILIIAVVILAHSIGCQMRETTRKRISDNQIVRTQKSYDYNELKEDLIELKNRHRERLEIFDIGKSVEGRKLYGVKLGNGEHKLVVTGTIHEREWMTAYLVMSLIELFLRYMEKGRKLEGYDINKLVKQTTLYFFPMINPDGVDLVINGVGNRDRTKLQIMNEGSEDFSRWKANIEGTDLNRQFNADWQDTISKNSPSFENYKGKKYLDQPESRALADFTCKERPSAVVAYHLSGSVIFWYYHQQGRQYKRDYKIAKKISRLTGYKLVSEAESDHIAAGYKDWFIKAFKRPGYTIEIGNKKYDEITVKDIDGFILENRKVILYLAREAAKIQE